MRCIYRKSVGYSRSFSRKYIYKSSNAGRSQRTKRDITTLSILDALNFEDSFLSQHFITVRSSLEIILQVVRYEAVAEIAGYDDGRPPQE